KADDSHPHLPSFPTRRSSDLTVAQATGGAGTGQNSVQSTAATGGVGTGQASTQSTAPTGGAGTGPGSSGSTAAPSGGAGTAPGSDRKSTRLNSSHVAISYAVF